MTISNILNKSVCLKCMTWLLLLYVNTLSIGAPAYIRPGNQLKITVSGHPEFTQAVMILKDGSCEYPLLAGVPIEGLSADDVKDLLRSALLRFDLEPDIFVIVTEDRMLKFHVFGEINHPGKFEAESPLNLQQALAMAGGFTEEADNFRVYIMRIENEKRKQYTINMNEYFISDSLVLPPEILDNDIITVPRISSKLSARVLGAVSKPGLYPVIPGDNLMDILVKAGGTGGFYGYDYRQNLGGDRRRIIHITHINGQLVRNIVNVHKFMQSGRYSELPIVSGGDLIIVPRISRWRDVWTWMERTLQVMTFVTTIIVFSGL